MPVWERESKREREPSSVRFTRHWGFRSYGQQSEPGHPTPPQSCKKKQLFFFCPVIPLTLCILSKCPHLSLTYGYNDNMYVFFIYTPSLKARSSNNWTKSADLCQAARFITYSDRERESERERKREREPLGLWSLECQRSIICFITFFQHLLKISLIAVENFSSYRADR